ncbi:hypothetical protein MSG28_007121 [Choristoneura fumiferana]|uniref:Uncharacterized protein n=1 Tax=Choristoneura fumiferana TaxID=7141 RepID=A0ACC0JMM6_CHOFU|nr:hypothetical protein MSG28_007121 [Choristoneura fumiferana]
MSSKVKKAPATPSTKLWWITFGVLCGATFLTRFYKVLEPEHVCWDETHFGKMASWYINRTFFFDVHPPLGKMLIALSGKLTGYDGTFPFDKPGDKYEGAKYEGMRIVRTLTAEGLPPFSGRLVSWQVFLGSSLACTMSVKFVGLFVVLFVGFRTIADLWNVLGDLSKPVSLTVKHLMGRSITLILWPTTLYVFFFWIHLTVLSKSGRPQTRWSDDLRRLAGKNWMRLAEDRAQWRATGEAYVQHGNGDGFYSSGFQARLIGNSLYNASAPRVLAYGAVVTLKNHRTGGGYLHSHHHLYPAGVGARQQQVTTYTHKDENNRWIVRSYAAPAAGTALVRSGDLVRLTHAPTMRNLHSHRERAPLTHKCMQVTGYGEDGVGDANDVWKIVIAGGKDGDEIQTVKSKLMLVHYLQRQPPRRPTPRSMCPTCARRAPARHAVSHSFTDLGLHDNKISTGNDSFTDHGLHDKHIKVEGFIWGVATKVACMFRHCLRASVMKILLNKRANRSLARRAWLMSSYKVGLREAGLCTIETTLKPIETARRVRQRRPFKVRSHAVARRSIAAINLVTNTHACNSHVFMQLACSLVSYLYEDIHVPATRPKISELQACACALTTTGKQLPKWGYEQQEVACNPNLRDKHALWNVEDNVYDDLPKVSFEAYASGFLERFLESHAVMLQGNAGLKPKEGEVTSQPWQWPINYRGQFFSGSSHRVYLLGNPVVWWVNLAFLVTFLVVYVVNAVRNKRAEARGIVLQDSSSPLLNAAGWSFVGWALHYVPFWAMGRVLYFHHYFPALVFSSMLTGILTEYLLKSVKSYLSPELGTAVYQGIIGLILSTTVYSFYLFAPLAYGMSGPLAHEPNSTMTGLRWLESWEF